MENKKSINHMEYVLVGNYYIPNLKFPNEERSIGKYGRMHREYLNEQAQKRLQRIVEQMKVSEGVTEELKVVDQMAWVRAMSSIYNRTEEIVLRELVYREDAV